MEDKKETLIYVGEDNRVYFSQNSEGTLKEYSVVLPELVEKELYDAHYLYDGIVFSFGYELNKNKVYGAIHEAKANEDEERLIYLEWLLCETIEDAIKIKTKELMLFDSSVEINEFFIHGVSLWFDKSTRMGLRTNIEDYTRQGKTMITWCYGAMSIDLSIKDASEWLSLLESNYALDCSNITHRHAATISKLKTIEEVKAYDFRVGYPDKLRLPRNKKL